MKKTDFSIENGKNRRSREGRPGKPCAGRAAEGLSPRRPLLRGHRALAFPLHQLPIYSPNETFTSGDFGNYSRCAVTELNVMTVSREKRALSCAPHGRRLCPAPRTPPGGQAAAPVAPARLEAAPGPACSKSSQGRNCWERSECDR